MKSSPGLTASGSSPLDDNSPSPNVTPKRTSDEALLDGASRPASSTIFANAAQKVEAQSAPRLATGEPAAKKKRLTPEEKAAKAKAEEEAKAKKAAEKEAKAKAEEEAKAERAAEKARKAEADRKKKEEAQKKEEEREKQRAKKEAEKKQQMEEQAKKERSQLTLLAMFGKPSSSVPKTEQKVVKTESNGDAGAVGTPSESSAKSNSDYASLFKPFFIKDNVKLASYPYEMDEETREAKSALLNEYVEGKRQVTPLPLRENLLEALQIPYRSQRGRVYPSVRKIMVEYQESSSSMPVDLTTESQTMQNRHALEALRAVPVKSLKFREDVRPPYVGTVSGLPPGVKSLRKVAIHPTARSVPSLNYDYDSEAEWQEEDGEDVDDLDDDEDDVENDEDMEDFLDDSDDVGPSRLVFSGGMEPESTGLCWEDSKRLNSPAKLNTFRMEFILGELLDDIAPASCVQANSWLRISQRSCPDRSVLGFILETCRS